MLLVFGISISNSKEVKVNWFLVCGIHWCCVLLVYVSAFSKVHLGGFVLNRFYFGPGLVWSRVRLAITTQDTNHTPYAKGMDILEGKGTQIAILLDA